MNLERFLETNKLNYTVAKTVAGGYINGEFKSTPKNFVTYREDTNQVLGVVGSRYEVIQNSEAFNFITELVDSEELELTKCAISNNGGQILIQAKLPSYITLKNSDIVDKYITFINSHDGSWTSQVIITPIRLVCSNQLAMLRKSKNKSSFTIRHTKNYRDRMSLASEMLGITNELFNIVENELNCLLDIPITDKQVVSNIQTLYFDSDEIKKIELGIPYNEVISTRKHNIVEGVRDFYYNGVGQDNIIGTANGFLNSISGFYSHNIGYDYSDLVMGMPSEKIKESFKLFV